MTDAVAPTVTRCTGEFNRTQCTRRNECMRYVHRQDRNSSTHLAAGLCMALAAHGEWFYFLQNTCPPANLAALAGAPKVFPMTPSYALFPRRKRAAKAGAPTAQKAARKIIRS
jgi:hypothetical protein